MKNHVANFLKTHAGPMVGSDRIAGMQSPTLSRRYKNWEEKQTIKQVKFSMTIPAIYCHCKFCISNLRFGRKCLLKPCNAAVFICTSDPSRNRYASIRIRPLMKGKTRMEAILGSALIKVLEYY